MKITKLSIQSLRGFGEKEDINFAVPNGKLGSGLTILVGANNSGKSTIFEAINLLSKNTEIFNDEMRNKNGNGNIKIDMVDENQNKYEMYTTKYGGAFAAKKYNNQDTFPSLPILILSTKRGFNSYFSNYGQSMANYAQSNISANFREDNNPQNNFGSRILEIYKNDYDGFTQEITKILPNMPKWLVDSSSNNQLTLKFNFNKDNLNHGNNGAGEGVNNLFVIVDSYYNTDADFVVLIDEPELSLHPDVQKNLMKRLMETSKEKQIIISTHSPYFVDFSIIDNGGKIIRTCKKEDNNSHVYELDKSRWNSYGVFLKNVHNPHILGTSAKEILFLSDNIILVEGQEDVIAYSKIFESKGIRTPISFFGWGVGSNSHFSEILKLLTVLGYEKVFVLSDGDKETLDIIDKIESNFPKYVFDHISAVDVRDKTMTSKEESIIEELSVLQQKFEEEEWKKRIDIIKNYFIAKERIGIIKNLSTCELKEEFNEEIDRLVKNINNYFSQQDQPDDLSIKKLSSSNNVVPSVEIKIINLLNNTRIEFEQLKIKIEKIYKVQINGGSGGSNMIAMEGRFYIVEDIQSFGINEECKIDINIKYKISKSLKILKINIIVKNQLESSSLLKKIRSNYLLKRSILKEIHKNQRLQHYS